MNTIFGSLCLHGIIEPGYMYVLNENSDRGWYPEPIEWLYVIFNEQQLQQALEMEYCIVDASEYELKEFLDINKLDCYCHEFKVLCIDKHYGGEIECCKYLHRILTFEESLLDIIKTFLGI